MKVSRIVTGLFFLLITSSALAQKVKVDFDRQAEFQKYKTFAWQKTQFPAPGLGHERITRAINAQLTAKGLQKENEGHPDMYVTYRVTLRESINEEIFVTGGPVMPTQVTSFPSVYLKGTLMVDVLDAGTKMVFWRGVAVDTVSNNPQKNKKKIERAAKKMFKNFPPKK